MPPLEAFPSVKEVKYIASRKELKESSISDTQKARMFDDSMYKITLRSIHELLEADSTGAIDAVSFNGWVKSINKATGKEENNCILTIQVKKEHFLEIDLSRVDPKTCFKKLKGVAAAVQTKWTTDRSKLSHTLAVGNSLPRRWYRARNRQASTRTRRLF
jgi:restriction system protein